MVKITPLYFLELLPQLLDFFKSQVASFQAGNLSQNIENWRAITSDKEILGTVAGMPIEFIDIPPRLTMPTNSVSKEEETHILREIQTLSLKGVIKECPTDIQGAVSPIFLRMKSDGTYRLILNLKKTNEYVEKLHFKMDTIHTVLSLVTPNCYLSSIDIKVAYYSVRINECDQKYLKFQFNGQHYQFTCLPNGLSSGPRKFTKLMKAPLAELRKRGHLVSAFIDDLINFGDSYEDCLINLAETIALLQKLGFIIHPDKSHLTPTQEITFLGFVINSNSMTISLTEEKSKNIVQECKAVLSMGKIKIRHVARIIGKLIATFPAVKYGPLHFRFLESCKSKAIKVHKGNYDSLMSLDENAIDNLVWWTKNTISAYNEIFKGTPVANLYTDASNLGWGAVYRNKRTQGGWNRKEQQLHINALELKAILFGLQSLVQDRNIHLQILCDNTSAVHILNKMGSSHSIICDSLVRDIWAFAISQNLWISASHIPGKQNAEADKESREHELQTEWKLSASIFQEITSHFQRYPDIDLFASRLNYQLKPFVSYRADPEASAVNAFQLNWSDIFFYAFPPFCIIGRVQKIILERAEGILVVPKWPNQPWFSRLTKLLKAKPLYISRRKRMLHLPGRPGVQHPLHRSLQLMACLVGVTN